MPREIPEDPRPVRDDGPRTYREACADAGARLLTGFSGITRPKVDVDSIKPRVERAVLGFGFVNPMLALPQIYNIFVFKHVAGLSLITIASALVMSVLWMAYGALSKQMVVWATSALWVVLNGATLVGVAMFSH